MADTVAEIVGGIRKEQAEIEKKHYSRVLGVHMEDMAIILKRFQNKETTPERVFEFWNKLAEEYVSHLEKPTIEKLKIEISR
jgi:hypothetical protein